MTTSSSSKTTTTAAKTTPKPSWAQPGDPESLIELTALIDEGSVGAVFKGIYGEKGGVAVKVVCLDVEEIQREVLRELDYMKRAAPCPYIVGFFGAWEKENHAWMCLELCETGSIIDVIQIAQRTLKPDEVRCVCASVTLALAFLHDLNIVHRDIKGKNILLTRDGKVKLCDLGVAIDLPSSGKLSEDEYFAGSPHWADPAIIGGLTTAKCDVWSLGVTIIELVEAEPPHADTDPMQVLEVISVSPPPKLKRSERSKIWKEMESFLVSCCTLELDRRPSSRSLLNHPFIDSEVLRLASSHHATPNPYMTRFVNETTKAIVAYRDYEAKERAKEAAEAKAAKRPMSTARPKSSARPQSVAYTQNISRSMKGKSIKLNQMTLDLSLV
jgi:serine/threonine protein kinase